MIRRSYRVPDMTCPNCAMLLEGMQDDLAGILRLTASYRKGSLEVEFDEALVSEAQILAEAARRGYTLESVPTPKP